MDRVYHGPDALSSLPGLLEETGIRKPLVISNRSVSHSRFYASLLKSLPQGISEFREITQHSPMEETEHAAEMLRNNACDAIITIGGGSVIDAGKVARYYYDISLKHIAIPTTLSAAEFSHIAGYTIGGEKSGIRDRKITPNYVFLDPAAVIGTPEALWRSTGIRALDHAIETLISNPEGEVARTFSILAVKKLLSNLEYNTPESRYECLLAAWYSYFDVYDAPMGLSHNIGKVIGAKWEVPHGITSCITLPQVMKLYARDYPEILSMIAGEMGFSSSSQKDSANRLARYIEMFIARLGLDRRLTDYGITEADLDYIIGKLKGDPKKLRRLLTGMF